MTDSSSSSSSSSSDDSLIEIEWIFNIRRSKVPQDRISGLQHYGDEEFRRRFRLTKRSFLSVCDIFRNELENETARSFPLSAEDKLLLTLRFYATGSFQTVLGDIAGVDQATVCRHVNQTTKVIAARFNEFIFMPTIEEQEATNVFYYTAQGIPGIIGLIDGTHIPINSPGGESSELFRNRKGYFSINVQVVCDQNYRIIDLMIVFYLSSIYIIDGLLQISRHPRVRTSYSN